MSFFSRMFGPKRIDISEEEMTWTRNSPGPSTNSRKQSGGPAPQGIRSQYNSDFSVKSPAKFGTSPGPLNVFGNEAPGAGIKTLKPNSSNFFRYRAEKLKQSQQQKYNPAVFDAYDIRQNEAAYYERPTETNNYHNGNGYGSGYDMGSSQTFGQQQMYSSQGYHQQGSQVYRHQGSQGSNHQGGQGGYHQGGGPLERSSNYHFETQTSNNYSSPASQSQHNDYFNQGWGQDSRGQQMDLGASQTMGFQRQHNPLEFDGFRVSQEAYNDIERRVSTRMLNDEPAVPQPKARTRTDIFAEPASKPTPTSNSLAFPSRQSMPSLTNINAITARPETSMRKLQIFEKIATDERESKSGASAANGKAVAGSANSVTVASQAKGKVADDKTKAGTAQVIRPNLIRKQEPEFQDFDQMVAENRRLAEELQRLEHEHALLMKDPHNMNVQEANFRILLESCSDEERKRDALKKDLQTLNNEIGNRQSELNVLRMTQGTRNPALMAQPDFKERERLVNEIEKARNDIVAKQLELENQRMNEGEWLARVRTTGERQMQMELESMRMTVNNSDEALLKELKQFEKEFL